MTHQNPIVSLQVTTHRNYINAVVSREHGSRHHSSITPASRLRLASAQQRIIEATAPDELKPYSFGFHEDRKKVVRWTTGALAADPVALCEYDDCDQAALPGGELCTTHQAALAPMRRCYSKSACEPDCPWRVNCLDDLGPAPAVTISPETTTELRQLITTELEAEQRWTAEEIMRREG